MIYIAFKLNTFQIFTKSNIIENRDVLMTIIVMLKFTQSPRPNVHVCQWFYNYVVT